MKRKNGIFYSLNTEDIQTVATEAYGRELNDEEINKIIEPIENSIAWYDIIDDCISLYLDIKRKEDDEDV